MVSFDPKDYTPDVQAYMRTEWLAADNPMYKGETYINTLGIEYEVLADAPAGNSHVRVKCNYWNGISGYAIREIPKIILCS